MKVFWIEGGLHLEPQTDADRKCLSKVEAAVRALVAIDLSDEQPPQGYSNLSPGSGSAGISE